MTGGRPGLEISMEKLRAKMPIAQRAKQFMPFAAVSGLDIALRRKEEEIDAAAARGEDLTARRFVKDKKI